MRGNDLGPTGPVLLIVVVAAALLVGGVGFGAYRLISTDAPAVTSPETTQQPSGPKESPSAEAPDSAGDGWRAAARRFGVAFTATDGGHRAWMQRLRPLVSPSLAQGYSYTDIRLVPTARLSRVTGGAEVAGETHARSAQLRYADGLVVDVTVALNPETDKWIITTAIPHEDTGQPTRAPTDDSEETNV